MICFSQDIESELWFKMNFKETSKNEILENVKSRRKEGEIKNIVRYPALSKYYNDFTTHWEGLDLNIYLNRP